MNDLIQKLIQRNKELKAEISQTNIELCRLNGAARDDFDKRLEEAYQRGLNDAWETARKIVVDTDHGGLNLDILHKVFDSLSYPYILHNNTAQEAIDKLKAYEEKQKAADETKVDVVRCKDCEHFLSPYGCRNGMIAVDEKGFCSYGARKKLYIDKRGG